MGLPSFNGAARRSPDAQEGGSFVSRLELLHALLYGPVLACVAGGGVNSLQQRLAAVQASGILGS